MLDVAPLDYERYAVFVTPLQLPEIASSRSAPAQREIEAIGQVNSKIDRQNSPPEDGLKTMVDRQSEFGRNRYGRETDHPKRVRFPTDLGFSPVIFESVGRAPWQMSELDPSQVARLYERPEKHAAVALGWIDV